MTDWSALFTGPIPVKIGALLGTLASMNFAATKLKVFPAFLSIVFGVIGSLYITQIVLHFYPTWQDIKEPVAFLGGLFSMNALGGFFVKFERFRKKGDLKEFSDVKVLKDILK